MLCTLKCCTAMVYWDFGLLFFFFVLVLNDFYSLQSLDPHTFTFGLEQVTMLPKAHFLTSIWSAFVAKLRLYSLVQSYFLHLKPKYLHGMVCQSLGLFFVASNHFYKAQIRVLSPSIYDASSICHCYCSHMCALYAHNSMGQISNIHF